MSDILTPEFSRAIRLDQVGHLTGSTTITADAAEREGLQRRFSLIALDALEADYVISEENGSIFARGRVRASLSQSCVATGLPVPERIDSDFLLRFVAEDGDVVEGAEMELDAGDCDTIGYSDNIIDMGEAVAETMALVMAPYPRAPEADAVLKEAGVVNEDQAGPFAALLALKGRM